MYRQITVKRANPTRITVVMLGVAVRDNNISQMENSGELGVSPLYDRRSVGWRRPNVLEQVVCSRDMLRRLEFEQFSSNEKLEFLPGYLARKCEITPIFTSEMWPIHGPAQDVGKFFRIYDL